MRNLRELNINDAGQVVSRPAPTESQFAELEAAVGAELPSSYKALLRIANGGHPELNSFASEGEQSDSRWTIDIFYDLTSDKRGQSSVWRALSDYSTVLKPFRLPIGRDEGGNQIVMSFDDSPPSVKVAVHDDDFREIPIAKSVDRFFDLLSTDPEMI